MLRFDLNPRWLFTELPMPQRLWLPPRLAFVAAKWPFSYEYPAKQVMPMAARQTI